MTDRLRHLATRLRDTVLGTPGALDPGVRAAISARATLDPDASALAAAALPPAVVSLADKVVLHSYKVTDEDIAAVRAEGLSEDAVYELVGSAALGAGMARLERGLAALKREG